ncbi:MAG: hypothetical protein RLZ98_125 [Pseudomonadota bacterium]|jgi:hypothetical protein
MTAGRNPERSLATAEEIAIKALVFLAEDPERLSRFLAETGMSPDDLRGKAGDRATLAAVLDHLLADESLLLVFTSNHAIGPETIGPALHALAGRPPAWDT